jgi:DNA-3-methyladenine glycosylase II
MSRRDKEEGTRKERMADTEQRINFVRTAPHANIAMQGLEDYVRKSGLEPFYDLVADDPNLGPLARRFCGLKPPRFSSLFEAVVNGIACQQVTLTQGIRALNRLAESYGLPFADGGEPSHAFPRAEGLAGLDIEQIRAIGITRQKSRAIIELAEALSSGSLDLEALRQADDQEGLTQLLSLRGVGRWTAEYVMLRGLDRLGETGLVS